MIWTECGVYADIHKAIWLRGIMHIKSKSLLMRSLDHSLHKVFISGVNGNRLVGQKDFFTTSSQIFLCLKQVFPRISVNKGRVPWSFSLERNYIKPLSPIFPSSHCNCGRRHRKGQEPVTSPSSLQLQCDTVLNRNYTTLISPGGSSLFASLSWFGEL